MEETHGKLPRSMLQLMSRLEKEGPAFADRPLITVAGNCSLMQHLHTCVYYLQTVAGVVCSCMVCVSRHTCRAHTVFMGLPTDSTSVNWVILVCWCCPGGEDRGLLFQVNADVSLITALR